MIELCKEIMKCTIMQNIIIATLAYFIAGLYLIIKEENAE